MFYVEMLINSQELELYSRTNELVRVQANILNIEILSMKSYLGLKISLFVNKRQNISFLTKKKSRTSVVSRRIQ